MATRVATSDIGLSDLFAPLAAQFATKLRATKEVVDLKQLSSGQKEFKKFLEAKELKEEHL